MDKSTSDEDLEFIRRPLSLNVSPVFYDDDRPSTPPMDHSLKVNRSLGLVVSPRSPPYRRIRSMNLMESPRSPRMCLLKNKLEVPNGTSTPAAMPSWVHGSAKRLTKSAQRNRSNLSCLDIKDRLNASCGNIPAVIASANPFTPDGRAALEERKSRPKRIEPKFQSSDSESCEEESSFQRSFKKLKLGALRPRFSEEFVILQVLGNGNHGCVFLCRQIFNGCLYAIKRTPRGVINELNEVYAHGVLDHPNVVRNYSSWTEPEYIFMQNEYCNGGTLDEVITNNGPLDEKQLYDLLEQVTQGLRYIHDKQLAHMDIKPENILITSGIPLFYNENRHHHNDSTSTPLQTMYKIGDLGHIVNLGDSANCEEGDCRYIPKEILNDNQADLTKVDIFSLGLTMYEAAGGGSLPKNGDQWHDIRSGIINPLPDISPEFYFLIKRMIEPTAELRPSAKDILATLNMEKENRKLKEAQQRIEFLDQQLSKAVKCVRAIALRSQKQDKLHAGNLNNNTSSVNKNSVRTRSARLLAKGLKPRERN